MSTIIIDQTENGDTRIRAYSVSEYSNWLDNQPHVDGSPKESKCSPRKSWDLNLGFKGAMEMGKEGGYWPEGTKRMLGALEVQRALNAEHLDQVREFDVAGRDLDVPELLAENPEHWELPEEGPPKPVTSIFCYIGAAALVDAKTMANVGAAVMSAVETIEMDGTRCELWAGVAVPQTSREDSKLAHIEVMLKGPDQPFNAASFAFAMSHPAFFRRLVFANMERVKEWQSIANSCYGYGGNHSKANEYLANEYDVCFPSLYTNMNAKEAREYVQERFAKSLND